MKRVFFLSFLIAVLSMLGCTPEEQTPSSGVQLKFGKSDLTSLTFIATPKNAVQCAYVCIKADQELPTAQEIFSTGTEISAQKEASYQVEGLEINTAYNLIAAARTEEGEVLSNVLKMTTLSPDDPSIQVFLNLVVENVGTNSIQVKIVAKQALECRYICYKADAEAPSNDDIISGGKEAGIDGANSYTVDGLEMDTEYIIAAVAKCGNKEVRKEVMKRTDTTLPVLEIQDVQLAELDLSFSTRVKNLTSYTAKVTENGNEILSEQVEDVKNKTFTIAVTSQTSELIISLSGTGTDGAAIEDSYQVDPETDIVRHYEKMVNILQFTATWCGYCPQMVTSLDKYEKNNPGRIAVIAVHGDDDMTLNPQSFNLMKAFGIGGFPTALMDYRNVSSQSYSDVRNAVEDCLDNNPSTTDIKLESTLSGSSYSVKATVRNAKKDARYKYACALVEDGIKYSGGKSPTGLYDDVLRHFFTNEFGDEFTCGENLPCGGEGTEVSFSGAAQGSWNAENLSAVFYTFKYDEARKQWFVDNTNVVRLGETAEFHGMSK